MNLDENAWISGIRHQASPTAADVTVYLLTVEHQGSTLPQQQLDERPENQKPGNSQTCEREFVNREKREEKGTSVHTLSSFSTLRRSLFLSICWGFSDRLVTVTVLLSKRRRNVLHLPSSPASRKVLRKSEKGRGRGDFNYRNL